MPKLRSFCGRAGRSPSVHFAVFGLVLFLLSRWLSSAQADERPRVVLPAARVAEAERTFQVEQGRPATAEERTRIVENLIDEEVLFQYALALELHHGEVPQRRLASIAAFVGKSEDPGRTPAELAEQAVYLGLHEGDFVTRRILVDAAARLIRAAARLTEPTEDELAGFFREHGERFREEPSLRISQILFSAARRKEPAADASVLLARLHQGEVSPERVAALADPGSLPGNLPLLSERGLARRFDPGFVADLAQAPVGQWSGPVISRHGAHLVFVHERQPGRIPELPEVHEKVLALWHEIAAERWLAERLGQLRREYEVVHENEATI